MLGQTISHYRIIEKLGGGGMGVVYKAEDVKLHRFVALKFLPDDVAKDAQALARFQREAQAASALNHPNICTIHEIDEQDGKAFIVMEYLDGMTLKHRIGNRPMETDMILSLAIEFADALDAAHAEGILHRDIKPANIFVTKRGHGKILDFGLAKVAAATTSSSQIGSANTQTGTVDEQHLTSPGSTLGTVAYMSPEQVRARELDCRTDLFSFGAVLHEMATGAVPFRGESTGVIFESILNRTPTPAVRLNPDLPPKLEEIINKCLEKDRNLRYQHASEIRTDLQRLKRDIESNRITGIQVLPEKMPRHRKLWLVLGVCVAAIGLAAIGTWFLRSSRSPQIDSIAVLPFTNVSGDTATDYLSDGITESLIASLTHVPELKVKSRNSVFRYKGKDVDMQKAGNELGVSALVSGRLTPHGDNVEVSAELTDVRDNTEIWGQHYIGKSTELIALPQQIAGDIAEKLRSRLSSPEKQQVIKVGTQNPQAYELYLKGRYYWNKTTSTDIATAISFFNEAIARDPGYALAYSGLADAYSLLASIGASPSESYPKSNAAARRALELDSSLARPHAVLGSNEMEYEWDFAGGEAEYKKALELDPGDATTHKDYAFDISMIGGREREALAEINRAHQLDPLSPVIGTALARVHNYSRQYDEAIVAAKKVAAENPLFAMPHLELAYGYRGQHLYPQVVEEWKVYGQLSGDPQISDFASAMEQGFRSGGWKGALTKGVEARQAQRKTGYSSSYALATMYADLGDKDQAFKWLNIAYQERDFSLIGLKTDFLLDPLRSDPQFAELVRKVGLPQ